MVLPKCSFWWRREGDHGRVIHTALGKLWDSNSTDLSVGREYSVNVKGVDIEVEREAGHSNSHFRPPMPVRVVLEMRLVRRRIAATVELGIARSIRKRSIATTPAPAVHGGGGPVGHGRPLGGMFERTADILYRLETCCTGLGTKAFGEK